MNVKTKKHNSSNSTLKEEIIQEGINKKTK